MKKVTKKFVSEFLDSTKGDLQWSVISFEKATGKRAEAYLAYNFFMAFAQMTEFLKSGKYDVILTDKKGIDAMNELERYTNRCSYDKMLPYAICVDSYNFKVWGN